MQASTDVPRRLHALVPGYEHNRDVALAILGELEGLVPVDARMAQAIRELAGVAPGVDSGHDQS